MAKKIRNRTKIVGKDAKATEYRTLFACVECGDNFSLPNCHAKRPNVGKYCTALCQKTAETKRKEKRRRECPVCFDIFYPRTTQINRGGVIYCSHKCQGVAFTGEGNPMHGVSISKKSIAKANATKKHNGSIKYGSDHPSWKGGSITQDGYRILSVNGKQMLEHRFVVECKINRKLSDKEIIHHVDRNKLNNCIDNLKVVTRKEHGKIHTADRSMSLADKVIKYGLKT